MTTLGQDIILKYVNEDFRVTEVSLVMGVTSSDPKNLSYTLIVVRKSGYTTFEALGQLARFFGLQNEAVHCQGLKDEDGVTEQLMSVNKVLLKKDVFSFNKAHGQLEKGWISIEIQNYSDSPLQEKQLHGNVFAIRLRNMSGEQADKLFEFCRANEDFMCANYYDEQRFGLPGGPATAHKIGQAVVAGNWDEAEKLYRKSGNVGLDFPDFADKTPPSANYLIKEIDPRKLNFFISAYASYTWNKALSRHIKSQTTLAICPGHDVRVSEDFAYKIPLVISSTAYKLGENNTCTQRQKTRSSFIGTTIYPSDKRSDEAHPGRYTLNLHFFLPAGSYATMLIKQLLMRAL